MAPQTIQTIPEPSHKRRNLIIGIVVAALVLIIGIWAVVAAINSVNKHGTGDTTSADNTSVTSKPDSTADSGSHNANTGNPDSIPGSTNTSPGSSAGSSSNSPANNYTPSNRTNESKPSNTSTTSSNTSASSGSTSTSNTNSTPTTAVNNVPTTGPEDMIPTFLLIGIATYLITFNSRLRRERRAIKV